MKAHWMLKGLKFLVMALVALTLVSFVIMGLWNALIPELFHGPTLTYLQALGLLLLSHLLLRGWHPGHFGWQRERWRRRFEEKLAAMTPEEREKFRQEWKGRCGPWPDASESH